MILKTFALSVAVCGCIAAAPKLQASENVIVGSVRVQTLSRTLVRLEVKGLKGFEDRKTFHVVDRDWPGVSASSNSIAGEVLITTPDYVVHVPQDASSLTGTYVTSPSGEMLYQFSGALNNSVWLPGPADQPKVFSFADSPRLVPPPGGVVPVPVTGPFPQSSGWDTNNESADVYVFVPGGDYRQLRQDFLKLTGPSEMPPLYAFGSWDSRWYDYDEASALAQIDEYRSRQIPLDVLVCDTGWRLGASTGYQPNTNLFPNLPRFFSEAHEKNVRVMFNDHPEPVASSALAPAEVDYRFSSLTQLLDDGLDVWWYDRNWSVSLLSPSPKLRHEVWGMAIFHDATQAAKPALRPMIMANIDGIDNGVRNRPPNVAAHRYSIQWTGDIGPSMTYLRYAVENAVHSGVQSLFPYESDDLGGHVSDPPPSGYIRWIEYGALSPTYRPHCTHNLERMPWAFGAEAEWIARRFINLRYRLLPVFYAAARENFDSGEPILRRLDLDYPQYPEAKNEDQYLLGHSILVAPILTDGLKVVPSDWLTAANGQPGLDAAYFSNTNLAGDPTFTRIDDKIDFNWNSGSPGNSVPAENWSARWTGKIKIPAGADEITLATVSDDGIRVWIDNELRMDNWGPNDSVTTESPIVLKPGQTYALRVEYLQLGGNDIVALKWRTSATRSVWIPPGNWINAWTGAVLKGPQTLSETAALDRIPLYIRSGSIIALAPEMQFTGQRPWSPITLDVYPSTTETDRTSLYEDDTTTTAYKTGEFRKTALTTWADDSSKKVSVLIEPAKGNFPGALSQRSWTVRWHRPPNWAADLMPTEVTLDGQSIGPIVRRVKNTTAMPLGSDSGAPDADVFEVTLPESSVLDSNLVVATFTAAATSPWTCGDIMPDQGNVFGGSSIFSNSVWNLRGVGSGLRGTNDGFHFLFQPCLSNAELTVHLSGQESVNPSGEAGIMIRESLASSAPSVTLAFGADNQLVFQQRSLPGAPVETAEIAGYSTPCWLRLVRSGTSFTAAASKDRVTWMQVGSAAISQFSQQAYIGLAVTAGIASSNSVDNAGYNEAIFDEIISSNTVAVSIVPDQTAAQAASVPPIPFHVSSHAELPATVSASSSNTNLLSAENIVLTGTGETRWITLAPQAGVYGNTVITLIASDGVGLASTQFKFTVLPLSGTLLTEDFIHYSAGNLPGQAYRGTGFATGIWTGLDTAFDASVPDAGVVSASGFNWPSAGSPGGKITVKGNGANVAGVPDLSTNGPFAAAGCLDSASQTIGGGEVSGVLYVSFLFRAVAANHNGEYGGLHLSRGTDETGVLIGNNWNAQAYSLDSPQTRTTVDLKNNAGDYLLLNNEVHLLVVRITYNAGGDDTLTAWLDPALENVEATQNSPTTYVGSVSGDFSFDRFFLRGGNANQFEYGRIRMGTSWASVLPDASSGLSMQPLLTEPAIIADDDFQFSFSGLPGQSYSVLASSNLSSPNWEIISTGSFGFDPVSFRAALSSDEAQRFFRVSIP